MNSPSTAAVLALSIVLTSCASTEEAGDWQHIGTTTRAVSSIEVKTWTESTGSCNACASVSETEVITVQTGTPSIPRVKAIIEAKLGRHRNSEAKLEVNKSSESKLRLLASGIKGEVLQRLDYWEFLFFDVSLAESKRTPRSFELSLTLSGKFKAGGLPATISGYGDMTTSGYTNELDSYAKTLVATIVREIESSQIRSSGLKW